MRASGSDDALRLIPPRQDVYKRQVLILTVKGGLRMGLIDLFQKTRETSMDCLLYTSRCV